MPRSGLLIATRRPEAFRNSQPAITSQRAPEEPLLYRLSTRACVEDLIHNKRAATGTSFKTNLAAFRSGTGTNFSRAGASRRRDTSQNMPDLGATRRADSFFKQAHCSGISRGGEQPDNHQPTREEGRIMSKRTKAFGAPVDDNQNIKTAGRRGQDQSDQ